jgi:anti-sigma B factor antagonist
MSVSIKTVSGITVIELEGKIDNKTAPEVQGQALAATKEQNKVILDMTKVDFLSSAGLRVLLLLYRQIKAGNGKIALVGLSDEIKDVMTVTGFINFFTLTDTMDAGINELSN